MMFFESFEQLSTNLQRLGLMLSLEAGVLLIFLLFKVNLKTIKHAPRINFTIALYSVLALMIATFKFGEFELLNFGLVAVQILSLFVALVLFHRKVEPEQSFKTYLSSQATELIADRTEMLVIVSFLLIL